MTRRKGIGPGRDVKGLALGTDSSFIVKEGKAEQILWALLMKYRKMWELLGSPFCVWWNIKQDLDGNEAGEENFGVLRKE